MSSFVIVGCCVAMVLFGAFQSVTSKLLYQTTAPNIDGEEKNFDKPCFQLWVMFASMGCLFLGYLYKTLADYLMSEKSEREKEQKPKIKLRTYLQMVIPSLCDLTASLLMNIALIWISVSVCQMLRSLIVIFTGVFTLFVRKRRLVRFEYVGGSIVVFAVALLGFVEIMDDKRTMSKPQDVSLIILGICLMIIAQAIQGFQAIVEEALMHDIIVPSIVLVSVEGIWGCVLTTVVFLPLMSYLPFPEGGGFHESFFDTVAMLQNSHNLVMLVLFYAIFSAGFNFFYMTTMDLTNALTTDIVQQLRNLLVWAFAVFIHYSVDPIYGEGWDMWSIVELAAFVLMSVGILVFHGAFKVVWLSGDGQSNVVIVVPDPADSPTTVGEKEVEAEKTEAGGAIIKIAVKHAGYQDIEAARSGTSAQAGAGGFSPEVAAADVTSSEGLFAQLKRFVSFISPPQPGQGQAEKRALAVTAAEAGAAVGGEKGASSSKGGENEPLLQRK